MTELYIQDQLVKPVENFRENSKEPTKQILHSWGETFDYCCVPLRGKVDRRILSSTLNYGENGTNNQKGKTDLVVILLVVKRKKKNKSIGGPLLTTTIGSKISMVKQGVVK